MNPFLRSAIRTPASKVVLQLKTPYRDGTTHLVITSLEFLQRLATLGPRPRLHLIRFHGMLAPNATLRSQIVPGDRDQTSPSSNDTGDRPTASLDPITQMRLRHHHLSAVRRPL